MFTKSLWTMAVVKAAEEVTGEAATVEAVAETASTTPSAGVIMILGFGTVFVGLLFLIGIITLMGKINAVADADPDTPFSVKWKRALSAFKGETPAALPAAAQEEAPALEAPVEEAVEAAGEVTDEEIAAISACIATVMGADVSAIRIASVTRIN